MKYQLIAAVRTATKPARVAVIVGVAALTAATACSSSSSNNGSSGAGSSSGSGSGNSPVTLTLFGADYGNGSASNSTTAFWQAAATAFHQAHPNITVNVQTVNWNDFPAKSNALIQNKQYPDIMEGNPPQQYAQGGIAYPLSQIVSPSTQASLIQRFLKDENYQGTPYGIPWTTSTRAMYYNKKIFTAAGISTPPTTWAELESDAAKIKAKNYIGYGMPLGSEEAEAEMLLWFLGNGGNYVDSSGNYAINSPQNIATLNFMKSFAATGDTQPNAGNTDRKEVWADFAAGKLGMVLGSPAVIPIIQQAGILKASDYGVADVPGKNGPLTQTLGVHDDIVVFKTGGTAHLAADKEFLDFVYQDQWQLKFDNEYDLLPATQSGATVMGKNPQFTAFLSNISNSVTYPSNANWTTVNNQIKTSAGQAITGSPSQVLNTIQQTASSSNG
jgi:multiple sugar transport system substrate-binding protein